MFWGMTGALALGASRIVKILLRLNSNTLPGMGSEGTHEEAGSRYSKSPTPSDYELSGEFLDAQERTLLESIEKAVGNDVKVLCKVRLMDVVSPKKNMEAHVRNTAKMKILKRRIGFLLVDAETGKPLGAVEMDRQGNISDAREQRNREIGAIFKAVGLPLVRIQAKTMYGQTEIAELLGIQDDTYAVLPQNNTVPVLGTPPPQEIVVPLPPCRKCGAPTAEKTEDKGNGYQDVYIVCNRYPECRGVTPYGTRLKNNPETKDVSLA